MKRNDLKEISEIQFLDLLRMLQNESFLDGWYKLEINEQIDLSVDYNRVANKEGVFDIIGWEKYQIDFKIYPFINSEYVDFDPESSGDVDYLESFEIERIELFDIEGNQINLSAEQRLKISTIIQERLTA